MSLWEGRQKGGGKRVLGSCVLHPLLASFSVHPELHSKLGSEVTMFWRLCRRGAEKWRLGFLIAPLFCLLGEPWKIITKSLSLLRWIKQGSFLFPAHLYYINKNSRTSTWTCSYPQCALILWDTYILRSSKREKMAYMCILDSSM